MSGQGKHSRPPPGAPVRPADAPAAPHRAAAAAGRPHAAPAAQPHRHPVQGADAVPADRRQRRQTTVRVRRAVSGEETAAARLTVTLVPGVLGRAADARSEPRSVRGQAAAGRRHAEGIFTRAAGEAVGRNTAGAESHPAQSVRLGTGSGTGDSGVPGASGERPGRYPAAADLSISVWAAAGPPTQPCHSIPPAAGSGPRQQTDPAPGDVQWCTRLDTGDGQLCAGLPPRWPHSLPDGGTTGRRSWSWGNRRAVSSPAASAACVTL